MKHTSNIAKSTFRPDIEGLRAIAVIAVLIFHLNKDWLPGGYIGVDVFFVLSGYLISTVVLRQIASGRFSIVQFAVSRIKRLMPALVVMLFVINVVALILMTTSDYRSFVVSAASALLYVSNLLFGNSFDYFGPASHELPLLHSWSLSVEMHLYIVSALVLLFVNARHSLWVFLAAIVGLLIWTEILLNKGASQFAYFATFTRAPEFLMGSVIGILHHRKLGDVFENSPRLLLGLQVLAILMLVGSFTFINSKFPFPGLMALPAVLATALLVYCGAQCLGRIFAFKPLVVIGGLSYSIYLWHWPILALLRYYTSEYYLDVFQIFGALTLIVLCSILTFRWVETPCRKLSFEGTKGVFKGLGLACTAGVVIGAVLFGGIYTNRMLAPAMDVSLTRYADSEDICHGHTNTNCARGAPTALSPIALIGDSHAGMLNLFADEVSTVIGRQIIVVSASSCVPIEGFDVRRIPDRVQAECLAQIEYAKELISRSDRIILAGKWNYHISSPAFRSGLQEFLAAQQAEAKFILILSQIPQVEQNPQRKNRFSYLGISGSEIRFDAEGRIQKSNAEMSDIAAHYAGATYLDLTGLKMLERAPYTAGVPFYYDLSHLNELGARLYGQQASACVLSWISGNMGASLDADLTGCFDA